MTCQSLFSEKNKKKKIANLSFIEFTHRVVKVKNEEQIAPTEGKYIEG